MKSKLLNYLDKDIEQKSPNLYKVLCDVSVLSSQADLCALNDGSTDDVLTTSFGVDEVCSETDGIGVLQRGCFHDGVAFFAVVSNLYDKETGELLDTFNEYWTDIRYAETKLHSTTQKARRAKDKNWHVVSTFTWCSYDEKAYEMTKEIDINQEFEEEKVVTDLSVTAPRAKDKKGTVVLYNREAFVTEKTDYHYNNVLVDIGGKQYADVHMPFEGSLSVAEEFEILCVESELSGEKPEMYLTFENEGRVNYNYTPQEIASQFTISEDKHTLTWKFNDDWKARMELNRFKPDMVLMFTCFFSVRAKHKTGGMSHPTVMVTSVYPEEKTGSAVQEIEPIYLKWGCVEKDTLIRMADGSQKPICSVNIGDWVMSEDGNAQVDNIYKGKESELVVLQTNSGNILKMTASHPVETKRGMINAGQLNAGDEIRITGQEKQFSAVKFLYTEQGDYEVYSLELKDCTCVVCNGIYTGDFKVQNSLLQNNVSHIKPKKPSRLGEELKRVWKGKPGEREE